MKKNCIAKVNLVLAFLGFLNATYLTSIFLQKVYGSVAPTVCDINSLFSCSSVITSPYAKFFGLPVCTVALPVYLVLLFLAWKALKSKAAKGYFYAISVLSGMGLMMNLIYTYNEYHFLKVFCLFCLICLGIITLNLAFSIFGYKKA